MLWIRIQIGYVFCLFRTFVEWDRFPASTVHFVYGERNWGVGGPAVGNAALPHWLTGFTFCLGHIFGLGKDCTQRRHWKPSWNWRKVSQCRMHVAHALKINIFNTVHKKQRWARSFSFPSHCYTRLTNDPSCCSLSRCFTSTGHKS